MIYLDYNASTPVDPAVREAMLPYTESIHGNPSSSHALGRRLRQAIEKARQQVAELLDIKAEEFVFTSGGTEANNCVIKGVAHALRARGRHIITSAVEHPAVLNPCLFLKKQRWQLTVVGVDRYGQVDPKEVADAIRRDTVLISIMLANNEVGTIQPIAEIAKIARKRGVLLHTDAAQACGKIDTSVSKLGVDFLSIAGHKMYAPQGIGGFYMRRGIQIEPLLHGAGHQDGRRAGTEPVALIVGLGKAAELAANWSTEGSEIKRLRDHLHNGLTAALGDGAVLLGHPKKRLPNTLAIGFKGCIGAEILDACAGVYASTGAACHSEQRKRSGVLAAMDVPEEVAFGMVRFSVGRYTTESEIDSAITQLTAAAHTVPVP